MKSSRPACGLVGLALHPGDRVAIWAASCPEWVLLQLACPRVGVVLVNVNPAYRALDLGYVIRKSRIRAIFHHSRDARANYDEILQEAIAASPCSLGHDIQIGVDSLRSMLTNGVDFADTPIDPHSVVNIQYTSGTTGNPKGVQLTHFNVVNNAWFTANALTVSERTGSVKLSRCTTRRAIPVLRWSPLYRAPLLSFRRRCLTRERRCRR